MTITFEELKDGDKNPTYELEDIGVRVDFFGYVKNDAAYGENDLILSANPATFHGKSYMEFSRPVKSLSFTVGYLESSGTATITAYGPDGRLFRKVTKEDSSVRETISFDFTGKPAKAYSIERVEISVSSSEPAGAGVNDVEIGDPIGGFRPPALSDDISGLSPRFAVALGDLYNTAPGLTVATERFSENLFVDAGPEKDIFSFTNSAASSKRFTLEVFDPKDPDDVRTFSKIFTPGEHLFSVVEDGKSGDYSGAYAVRLKSIEGVGSQTANEVYVLLEIFDGIGLSLVTFIDNAQSLPLANGAQATRALSEALGPIGLGLDLAARGGQIALADDKGREFFAQAIDAALDYSITYGLLAGGSIAGTPIAGLLASTGGTIVYNVFASSKVKEAARGFYDDYIAGDFDELTPAQRGNETDAGVLVDADAALADLISRIDLGDAPRFDEAFYLEQNPNVAEQISRGEIANAYTHYLSKGLFKGLLTSRDQVEPLDASQVERAGMRADLGARPEVLGPIFEERIFAPTIEHKFAGDGISDAERDFLAAMEERFDIKQDDVDSFEKSSRLWAVANRKAWDIVHNYEGRSVEEVIGATGETSVFSDGRLADEVFDISIFRPELLKFFATTSPDGTAEGAVEALAETFHFQGSIDVWQSNMFGVAEYGGVWVVALWESGSWFGGDVAEEEHAIDRIGSDSADRIDMGTWDGVLKGLGGNDVLFASLGGGLVKGGSGDDRLTGKTGNDKLDGGKDDDSVFGHAGKDKLTGREGDDLLDGGTGRDRLIGAAGDDILLGGNGKDRLAGGKGDDILEGGTGRDILIGGAGADQFHFGQKFGKDSIRDFEDGVDKLFFDLKLAPGWNEVRQAAEEVEDALVLRFGKSVLTIENMSLSEFDQGDVLFAA